MFYLQQKLNLHKLIQLHLFQYMNIQNKSITGRQHIYYGLKHEQDHLRDQN